MRWGFLAFLFLVLKFSIFWVTTVFGIVPEGVWAFALPVSAGALLFFNVSLFWKRTATFSIGRQQIRIDAWTGRLARRSPFAGPTPTEAQLQPPGERPEGVPPHAHDPGGETHQIGAIACTDEDLQTLTNVIEEAQRLSLPDAGTDADVPIGSATMGTAGKQAT